MSAALLDHLWQSTLFALGAWLLSRVLRGNAARLRYGVWLAASLKFVVPFSLLTLLGQGLQPYIAAESRPVLTALGSHVALTSLGAPVRAVVGESPGVIWQVATAVWIAGTLALLGRWLIRWWRVRKVVQGAVPAPIAAPVPVRTSVALREPSVVGIVRPVLLLPVDITSRLTAAQFEAVLRHELCHLRRRDNLTSAVHMLVEALFWFHPLVWWIGARLLEERERACDESVVLSGSDPRTYAEGILQVCRSYVASDLACVAGVSGAALKLRLEAIMTNEVEAMSVGKRFALGLLALAALAIPVMAGLASPARAEAGTQQAMKPIGKIELLAGKRVKLEYRNVDVRGLIQAMAEAASVNILVSDKVSGTVTVKLAEMPWDKALDVLLNSQGLVKREKDGILFVEPASA